MRCRENFICEILYFMMYPNVSCLNFTASGKICIALHMLLCFRLERIISVRCHLTNSAAKELSSQSWKLFYVQKLKRISRSSPIGHCLFPEAGSMLCRVQQLPLLVAVASAAVVVA